MIGGGGESVDGCMGKLGVVRVCIGTGDCSTDELNSLIEADDFLLCWFG